MTDWWMKIDHVLLGIAWGFGANHPYYEEYETVNEVKHQEYEHGTRHIKEEHTLYKHVKTGEVIRGESTIIDQWMEWEDE